MTMNSVRLSNVHSRGAARATLEALNETPSVAVLLHAFDGEKTLVEVKRRAR